MRVWVDLTNSPHVLVMRPLIEVDFERRAEHNGLRVRRDPRELVTLLLSATQA